MNCQLRWSEHPREPVTEAWGAMLEDVVGLWGTGEPDVDDVMETLAEHRPFIESAPAPAASLPLDALNERIAAVAAMPSLAAYQSLVNDLWSALACLSE